MDEEKKEIIWMNIRDYMATVPQEEITRRQRERLLNRPLLSSGRLPYRRKK